MEREYGNAPRGTGTPWGAAVYENVPAHRGHDRQSTRELKVPTDVGRAVVTFHVDPEVDGVPERLRVVMLGGYGVPGLATDADARYGESTLTVDGAVLGWRAQAYLDVGSGLPATTSLLLVDGGGKIAKGHAEAEDKVRGAVLRTFEEARETDPALVARLYGDLMRRYHADVHDELVEAERRASEVSALRTRLAARILEAGTHAGRVDEDAPAP